MNLNKYNLYRIKLANLFSGLSTKQIWEAIQSGKVNADDAKSLLTTRNFDPSITRELENIALNKGSYTSTMSLPSSAFKPTNKPFNWGKTLKGVGIGGAAVAGLGTFGAFMYHGAKRRQQLRNRQQGLV